MPHDHICFICGVSACFGLRRPGLLTALAPEKRGYIWHCAAHEPEAIAKRDRATGASTRDSGGAGEKPAAAIPQQGRLF